LRGVGYQRLGEFGVQSGKSVAVKLALGRGYNGSSDEVLEGDALCTLRLNPERRIIKHGRRSKSILQKARRVPGQGFQIFSRRLFAQELIDVLHCCPAFLTGGCFLGELVCTLLRHAQRQHDVIDDLADVEQLRVVMHGSNVRCICEDVNVRAEDVASEDGAGRFEEGPKRVWEEIK